MNLTPPLPVSLPTPFGCLDRFTSRSHICEWNIEWQILINN